MLNSTGTIMSRIDWVLLAAFIAGFLLFLYGTNLTIWSGANLNSALAAAIGYSGIYLSIGSIAVYLVIYVYKELKPRQTS
jgi:divalent metal cation (Fe/Co/Zn/Cd) transporter